LGQIIPPSTLLIILTDVMSNAYQQAQFTKGQFTIDTISVGEMFAAALVPGFLLVLVYLVYLLTRAWLFPRSAPALTGGHVSRPNAKEVRSAVLPPILLIVAVLGSILGGIATPSEAASIGAVGAFLMAGARLGGATRTMMLGTFAFLGLGVVAGIYPVRLQRSDIGMADWALGLVCAVMVLMGLYALLRAVKLCLQKRLLRDILSSTMVVTSMIFATILTASMFSLVFIGLGGQERVEWIVTSMPGGPQGALLFCMFLIFVLGFFLDFVEITVILLPLVAPSLILMGHDPVWLSILIAINLQTSFLTPPFGFSLFYLRGAAPPEISTGQIYRGVMPFIILQAVGVLILWLIPQLATTLPDLLF
jgi:TRAP-type mannitol/chloroaromatic compound transport system permease large subunit